jgi:aryl-alcohol dehydrogenase-like predicted oxidoreductase
MATTLPLVVLGCFNIGAPTDPSAKYNTPAKAQEFLSTFRKHGYSQLDTARSYSAEAPGTCESLMASLMYFQMNLADCFPSYHRRHSHYIRSLHLE